MRKIYFYSIVLHADWQNKLEATDKESSEIEEILGLYASRKVFGLSYDECVAKVKKRLANELTEKFSSYGGFSEPTISVDQVARLNLFRFLFSGTATKGMTYYVEE